MLSHRVLYLFSDFAKVLAMTKAVAVRLVRVVCSNAHLANVAMRPSAASVPAVLLANVTRLVVVVQPAFVTNRPLILL
jgi:hypothetical protein